jgi:hypothetical protein
MVLSSCGTFIGFTASLSLGKVRHCLAGRPKSSARHDLAVVVSRPVSIFLRVLTGFFLSHDPRSWFQIALMRAR